MGKIHHAITVIGKPSISINGPSKNHGYSTAEVSDSSSAEEDRVTEP